MLCKYSRKGLHYPHGPNRVESYERDELDGRLCLLTRASNCSSASRGRVVIAPALDLSFSLGKSLFRAFLAVTICESAEIVRLAIARI